MVCFPYYILRILVFVNSLCTVRHGSVRVLPASLLQLGSPLAPTRTRVHSLIIGLLLNILLETLGEYVDGLSAENLKLGVWSVEIELNNLKLKDGVLEHLNLPIVVIHGSQP